MVLHQSHFDVILNEPDLPTDRKDIKDECHEQWNDQEGRQEAPPQGRVEITEQDDEYMPIGMKLKVLVSTSWMMMIRKSAPTICSRTQVTRPCLSLELSG
jgi:hypothetical protein